METLFWVHPRQQQSNWNLKNIIIFYPFYSLIFCAVLLHNRSASLAIYCIVFAHYTLLVFVSLQQFHRFLAGCSENHGCTGVLGVLWGCQDRRRVWREYWRDDRMQKFLEGMFESLGSVCPLLLSGNMTICTFFMLVW